VIFGIRLPRILAALLVGAGLSVAGTSFQGLFKNPLVSPELLGVASGAGFGAALGILLSGRLVVIQVSAFLAGIMAVTITYTISRVYRSTVILVLVLSGIMVGALFSALISLIKYVADPYDTLPTIVFWLMGSLSSVSARELGMAAPPILTASVLLFVIRWRINLLAMGDDEARAIGVNTRSMSQLIMLCATVITASAVCISGIIGWVGLVVPHIGRLLVGPDFRRLVPASAFIGAVFLLAMDNLSRTVFPTEIPLGILTAIIGAPVFACLLGRRKVGWLL
jgi:iron complex transport system permease protein